MIRKVKIPISARLQSETVMLHAVSWIQSTFSPASDSLHLLSNQLIPSTEKLTDIKFPLQHVSVICNVKQDWHYSTWVSYDGNHLDANQ